MLGGVAGSEPLLPCLRRTHGLLSQLPTGLATPSVAEAAQRRGASDSPVGRIASSPSLDGGGFSPGTILGERYRIIGLLGRGGMGEVYRADDLKLGQPVALKFLPAKLASEPAWLDRFYAEVRLARGVSHPNVCRVYDIGEIEGSTSSRWSTSTARTWPRCCGASGGSRPTRRSRSRASSARASPPRTSRACCTAI